MKCPFCPETETKVVDSRLNQSSNVTRRRRECTRCEARFTTYERVEEIMPLIVKKDGRREAYSRDKILAGMYKSCQKRQIAAAQIERAADLIESKLNAYGLKELSSQQVGKMVMESLRGLDKVAYIRFASVYREFKDVEEFIADLKSEGDPYDFKTSPST